MAGLNLNIGSSILKRETKPMEDVTSQLRRNGWSKTGELGDSVEYYENSGMSITVASSPMGTVIFPSGPIRGRIFGNSGLMVNQTSVIGAGANTGDTASKQEQQARTKADQIT